MVPTPFNTVIDEDKLKAITLSTNKDLTGKDIAERIGVSESTIARHKSEAKEKGLLKLENNINRKNVYKPTNSLLDILSIINQTKENSNDKQRIAESFNTTFSKKEKGSIGKILEEETGNEEWAAIIQRMEDNKQEIDTQENNELEIDSRYQKIISMVINDSSTQKIANELGITKGYASKLRRDLYEEGFLDKEGGQRGNSVEWVKGDKFRENLVENEKEEIEPRKVETKEPAINKIDQHQLLTDYSVDKIFKHYKSGDILKPDQESLFDDIASDLNSTEISILSRQYMIDIIQKIDETNSVLEIKYETDYDKESIEDALSILGKANIIETKDLKYGLKFEISEKYDKVLDAVEKTEEILENPEQYRENQLTSIDLVPSNPEHEKFDIEAFEQNLYKLKLEENPKGILEKKLRDNNGEMKYSKLSDELGITQDNLVDYVVEARNQGLNLRRRRRDKRQWIYIEEDQENPSTKEESNGDRETNGAMISLDTEEAITDYRQTNNFDLGQEIDPKQLPGSKQVHHDGNSEKYRKVWVPKIKPLIEPLTEGDKLSYNEIYQKTEVPRPKGHQTVAWMATQFDSIETYENGIKIN